LRSAWPGPARPAGTARTGPAGTPPPSPRTLTARSPPWLQLEEQALGPRPGPVEPGPAEERPDDGEGGSEHEQHGEQRDAQLAVTRLVAGVAIDERHRRQPHQDEGGDDHAGDQGVQITGQLLKAKEVPRGLGRVRREVVV